MPNPFVPYILIFFGSFFSITMFWNFYDYEDTQATLIYFKNITSQLPSSSSDGITYSIKMRLNELTASKDPTLDPENSLQTASELNFRFYQDYMRENFGKYSKSLLFVGLNETLSLIGINSEWPPYYAHKEFNEEEIYSPFRLTDISMLCLKEEKLFGYNLSEETSSRKEWKYNFHHKVAGIVEAQVAVRKKKIMALGIYNPLLGQRMIRYYRNLTCNYSEASNFNTITRQYCSVTKDNFKGCHHANLSSAVPYEYVEIADYEDVPIPLEANDTIVNMAVDNNLVVFTTLNSLRYLHYVFRRSDGSWFYKKIKYDDEEAEISKFQIYQNLGIHFIGFGREEKILLIIDIEGGEEGLTLMYTVYKFTTGKHLLQKDDPELYKVYNFRAKNNTNSSSVPPEVQNNTSEPESAEKKSPMSEGEETETEKVEESSEASDSEDSYLLDPETIDPEDFYHSSQYLLTQTKVNYELFEYDPFQRRFFKNSLIYYHHESNSVICVSLEKYVHLIIIKKKLFGAYQLDFFEDSYYKIKTVDISKHGTLFAFLTYYKDNYRAYVLYCDYINEYSDTELFKIDFDYSLDPDRNDIKDVKFIADNKGQLGLLVLFASGELATYSLDFMPSAFGEFLDIFFEDEVSMLSFFGVFSLITMFLANRLRPRIIRINLPPNPNPNPIPNPMQ